MNSVEGLLEGSRGSVDGRELIKRINNVTKPVNTKVHERSCALPLVLLPVSYPLSETTTTMSASATSLVNQSPLGIFATGGKFVRPFVNRHERVWHGTIPILSLLGYPLAPSFQQAYLPFPCTLSRRHYYFGSRRLVFFSRLFFFVVCPCFFTAPFLCSKPFATW